MQNYFTVDELYYLYTADFLTLKLEDVDSTASNFRIRGSCAPQCCA